MQRFSIAAFYKNIIFATTGRVYACYTLPTKKHRFMPEDRKKASVSYLEELLCGLAGRRGKILLPWEETALDEGSYLRSCTDGAPIDPNVKDEFLRHVRSTRATISRGARKKRRFILVELSLMHHISDLQEFLTMIRDQALKTLLAIRPMEIPDTIKETASSEEEELYLLVRRYGLSRITFNDLDFMIRRVADRVGVLPPPLPERPGSVFTPAAVAAFTDGAVLDERVDHVIVSNGSGDVHYQSFIFFVDIPKKLPPTGLNIFQPSDIGFPFDAVIDFEVIPPHTATSKVESQDRLLTGQVNEALDGGQAPGTNEETGLGDKKVLQPKLEAGKPLARMSICLAIASRNLKDLRSKGKSLCQHYILKHFRAVRPAAKQMEALYSFLPGSPPAAPSVECDPGYIAATGPHFETELGDPSGFFLGWSGLTPVFHKPGRPALELDKTNAIVATGGLGSGKSTFAKDLAYCVMHAGGFVQVTDPKNEYYPFKELFGDLVRIMDISPRGGNAICPFVLSSDPIKSKSIALNYLTMSLYATGNEPRRLAISQGLNLLFSRSVDDRHMYNFREDIFKVAQGSPHHKVREEAEQCGYLLNTIEEIDVGRIAFGRSTHNFFEKGERMLVLNTMEIPRPSPKTPTDEYTEDERQGMALFYLLAAISREVAFGLPRNKMKLKLTDEAWTVAATSAGERLLDEEIRIGRTFGIIPVLATQNITDINKTSIITNISQFFCFRADSATETLANLETLGAAPNSVKAETFATLPSGTCLYKDAEGRLGWLEVVPQPSYLVDKYFDTKPSSKILNKVADL